MCLQGQAKMTIHSSCALPSSGLASSCQILPSPQLALAFLLLSSWAISSLPTFHHRGVFQKKKQNVSFFPAKWS
jgi:hypothetical protein